jgi:hypothetical protein
MFVTQARSRPHIAATLNHAGVVGNGGAPWTSAMVRSVLSNELCVGNYVYNRKTTKLKGITKHNAEEDLVRVRLFKPLISPKLFQEAQALLMSQNHYRVSGEDMLDRLRRLLKAKGRLSASLIAQCPYTLSTTAYRHRFGTLGAAYARIGYTGAPWPWRDKYEVAPDDDRILESLRQLRAEHGYLSSALIRADPTLPTPCTLAKRYGSLRAAYAMAGFAKTRSELVVEAAARRKAKRAQAGVGWFDQVRAGPSTRRIEDEVLLGHLRRLLTAHGYLSAALIRSDPEICSEAPFYRRFGSLVEAYAAVGFTRTRSELASLMRRRRNALLAPTG